MHSCLALSLGSQILLRVTLLLCGVARRDDVCQGHPMDSGFETALDTCLANVGNVTKAADVKATGKKQPQEKKVD